MPSAGLSFYLQVFSILGWALLAIKFFNTGLRRKYWVFFWFCCVQVADSLWPLFITNTSSQTFFRIWALTQPILWLFHILLVVELYRLILEGRPGIYSLGRWAMYAAVVIAVCISILSLLPHFTPRTTQQSKYLGLAFATDRGIDFALAVFLILILFFLSRFPIKLSRNVVVHAAVYTIYFFISAFAIFLRTLLGVRGNGSTSLLYVGGSCLCLVAWFIFLSPRGEEVQTNFHAISPEREKAALRQLESLNATLLKVSLK